MLELENRLKKHAEITKAVMRSPFDTGRKEFIVTKKHYSIKKAAALATAALCLVGTTAFAAFHLINAREVATALGDSSLAQYFDAQGTASATVCDGAYKATVLGITSGESLSSFKSSSWEIFPERTYVVTAIEKADGSAMTYDDEILVTPLISGLTPWQYNIFTMNGGYTADIIDGVLYRIIEFDSIEYFADRDVYIAVVSEAFLNNKPFSFDEATGKIEAKDDYEGTNILIKLELDKSKANPQKAQEYLDKLKESTSASDDASENEPYADDSSDETVSIELYENDEFNIQTDPDSEEPSLIITPK